MTSRKIVHPIVLSQWGTGGGTHMLEDKLLVVTALRVPAHQTPALTKWSVKPRFLPPLVSPSPVFGFGLVGFISHRDVPFLTNYRKRLWISFWQWFCPSRTWEKLHLNFFLSFLFFFRYEATYLISSSVKYYHVCSYPLRWENLENILWIILIPFYSFILRLLA